MSAKKDDSRCTTCDQWRGLDGYSRDCPWMWCVYGTKPCPRWEAAGRRHAKADVQLAQEANDEGRLF